MAMNPHDSLPGAAAGRPPTYEMKPRLLAAFLSMGVVILAASLFAALMLRNVDADSERIVEDLSRRASIIARLRQEFLLVRVAEKNLIIEDSAQGMDVFEQRIKDSESQIDQLLKDIERDVDPDALARIEEFRRSFTDFREALTTMIGLTRANTLAEATVLSRGAGRDLFQQGRAALVEFIERNRGRIAHEATGPENEQLVMKLTDLLAAARDALEGMHDLQYLEQAILTVFSGEERAVLASRLESQEERVHALKQALDTAPSEQDRIDVSAFGEAIGKWSANSREVRRLAQEDSKAKAMAISTSAVRDAYLRASQALDGLLQQSDEAMAAMHSAQEKALATGRSLLIGTAVAGLLVVAMTAWVVVNLLMREYRAAGDLLMRGA
jgi:CHASE3 domain sensor protein